MKPQLFTIVPASSGPVWLMAAISLMLLAIIALFAWLAYSSRHTRFEVSPEGLQIASTMYGRTIPAAALVVDGVRVLDLSTDREYRPRWRTNGAGLPGYQAGWFKLRNGEKSLCFITDRKRVVYVPTTNGYSVMVSVERPEEFKATLASMVP
jgi:hypothetical protein